MGVHALAGIKNEAGCVNKTCEVFDEDKRLNHSRDARVELLTTTYYKEKYLQVGNRILDEVFDVVLLSGTLYISFKGHGQIALHRRGKACL